jgi:pantetheine-phosphate adenylyltransferase
MSERTHAPKKQRAVYPGSFDPITSGHVDIIQRGLKIFDQILVAVLENYFVDHGNVEVKAFDGLLVEFAKNNNANIVIRGLRAISDFEYEFQMALMNRKLDADIETLFMMPNLSYSFLSSKLVKEIFMLGGGVKDLVPGQVEKKLKEKFKKSAHA